MQTKPVVNTVDVIEEKETEDIERNKLISYLNANLLIESNWNKCKIHRCSSGYSNPPYIIDCGSNRYILRTEHDEWGIIKKHSNLLLDIKSQFKLILALGTMTNIPVPKMYIFCDDKQIIGKRFYMMEFIEGRIFTHSGPDLPTIPKQDRIKIYKEIVRVLSMIHSVNIYKAGIYDMIKHKIPMTINGVFNEWKDDFNKLYKDKNTTNNILLLGRVVKEKYIEYEENNKDLQFNTLIHGDFHLENIIWHPIEYKIIAIVDWECCTVGNPLFELNYLLQIYRSFPTKDLLALDPPFEYHTGFRYIDLKKIGIPTEIEQINNYLYYAKQVLSSSKINKMIKWLQTPNNWTLCRAIICFMMTAAFYQYLDEEDENSRLHQTLGGKRQSALFDNFAVSSLLAIKQPLKLLPSKL